MSPAGRPAWRQPAILAAAGAAHALSFAPDPLPAWSLAPVQVIALAVAAHASLQAPSARRALARGWLFAMFSFSLGLYWMYVSMHDYGGLAAPLAAAGVLALSAFLALFPGLACAAARWLCPPHWDASPPARAPHALRPPPGPPAGPRSNGCAPWC